MSSRLCTWRSTVSSMTAWLRSLMSVERLWAMTPGGASRTHRAFAGGCGPWRRVCRPAFRGAPGTRHGHLRAGAKVGGEERQLSKRLLGGARLAEVPFLFEGSVRGELRPPDDGWQQQRVHDQGHDDGAGGDEDNQVPGPGGPHRRR